MKIKSLSKTDHPRAKPSPSKTGKNNSTMLVVLIN